MSVAAALPEFHRRERHTIRVAATPGRALAAARETLLEDVPLVSFLFRLRGLRAAPRGPIWDSLLAQGFRQYDAETLVLIGRPWSPRGGTRTVDDFVAFGEPGYAKIALELTARPDGGGALLVTETRVYLTDAASRRRFAAYWLAVKPFSGLTRRLWLRAAKRRAEGR